MLCVSECHKSMQCRGLVDLIATEVVGVCVGESFTGCWSWLCINHVSHRRPAACRGFRAMPLVDVDNGLRSLLNAHH